MPTAAPHFCAVPGCSQLTTAARCAGHAVDLERARPHYADRAWYRTKAWARLRVQVLRDASYQCAVCQWVTYTLEVDHIRPHQWDPVAFWDRANLQALCAPCHTRKTTRGE